MADASILDIPTEIDPVEEADIVIAGYRHFLQAGGKLPMNESFLLEKFIDLRQFIKEEMGY